VYSVFGPSALQERSWQVPSLAASIFLTEKRVKYINSILSSKAQPVLNASEKAQERTGLLFKVEMESCNDYGTDKPSNVNTHVEKQPQIV
jgi:hypothetical protein